MRRILIFYWLPVAVWTAIILGASTDLFSAGHTGSVLHSILISILGHDLAPRTFDAVHFAIRKLGHLTEYAILGALLFRAVRAGRRGWLLRWSVAAVAIAFVVASCDEFEQSFVPSRTASPIDVGIDTTGAALAQLFAVLLSSRE